MPGKRLDIALICREVSLSGGGVERYASTLIKNLGDMGHHIDVFAGKWDNSLDRRVTTHRVPIRKGLQSIKMLSFIRNCRQLLRPERRRFDIVCSLTQFYPQDVFRLGGAIWNVLMKRMQPARWRRTLKYLIADGYLLRLYIERKIFQEGNYRHVVAISGMVKRQLIRAYGIPDNDVTVIYNGVDLKRFNKTVKTKWRKKVRDKFRFRDDDIVLLFVGHDFRRKGLEYVIGALDMVDKGVKLLVAGKGDQGHYQRTAIQAGVNDRVVFAGPVEEMEQMYAASDIFVFPTLYDAFGSVGLEAMACGLPVVATKFAGFSELIEDRSNGILLDKPDTESLALSINNLLKDDLRSYLSENGIKTAEKFSARKNAEEMAMVFYKVLNAAPSLLTGSGQVSI